MQGRSTPLAIILLLVAAAAAGGCTAPETTGDLQQDSPAPPPLLAAAQKMLTDLPAPTPAAPPRENTTLEVRSVGFVDPATYHIPTPTPTIALTGQPHDLQVPDGMVDYATATVEYPPRVLATRAYHIPYPYWAVNVTVTPMNDYPWLRMEIYEKDDPNRIVREIRYSRSDILNSGNSSTLSNSTSSNSTSINPAGTGKTFTIPEGYGDFYLVIHSESLKSLTVTIKVPEKYLV